MRDPFVAAPRGLQYGGDRLAEAGDLALEAIRSTGGWASYASDRAMSTYSRLISSNEGLSVLPASTAGLIGLLDEGRREDLVNDRYVVILTGRR